MEEPRNAEGSHLFLHFATGCRVKRKSSAVTVGPHSQTAMFPTTTFLQFGCSVCVFGEVSEGTERRLFDDSLVTKAVFSVVGRYIQGKVMPCLPGAAGDQVLSK